MVRRRTGAVSKPVLELTEDEKKQLFWNECSKTKEGRAILAATLIWGIGPPKEQAKLEEAFDWNMAQSIMRRAETDPDGILPEIREAIARNDQMKQQLAEKRAEA